MGRFFVALALVVAVFFLLLLSAPASSQADSDCIQLYVNTVLVYESGCAKVIPTPTATSAPKPTATPMLRDPRPVESGS